MPGQDARLREAMIKLGVPEQCLECMAQQKGATEYESTQASVADMRRLAEGSVGREKEELISVADFEDENAGIIADAMCYLSGRCHEGSTPYTIHQSSLAEPWNGTFANCPAVDLMDPAARALVDLALGGAVPDVSGIE